MGHPMAKKGMRKRGDKFIKHRERRWGFTQYENDNPSKTNSQTDYDEYEEEDALNAN